MDRYNFLEHAFDATQLAADKVLGTKAIAVVTAFHETNELSTIVYNKGETKEENYRMAINQMGTTDGTRITNYIIGGDIDAND